MGLDRTLTAARMGALAVLLVACGASTPAADTHGDASVTSATPARSASAAPVASAAPSATPVARPATPGAPPTPDPAGPPGADPVAIGFAELTCNAGYRKTDSGYLVGCRECPQGNSEQDLVSIPEGQSFYPVRLLRGAFTAPGADEAILFPDSCASVFFVNDPTEGWAPTGSHVADDFCVTIRDKAGRDRLACTAGLAASDIGTRLHLYTEEITANAEWASDTTLIKFFGDAESACVRNDERLVHVHFEGLASKDVNGDGDGDVVVHLHLAEALRTPPIKAKLAQLCKPLSSGPPLSVDAKLFLPAATDIELVWVAQHGAFVPTTETTRKLRSLPVWTDPPAD